VPHYVDELNYLNYEIIITTEGQRSSQLFLDGKNFFGGADDWNRDDLPFDTVKVQFARNADQWSFTFNGSVPPTSSRHFRRAIAYMTNRKQYMRPSGVVPDKVVTPFMTPDREQRNVSEDVLNSLTDYGWDEVRQDAATREMQEGGFERNSNGQWLFKEGERAGEPMEFSITTFAWQDHVGNQGTDFRQAMSDWGIELSVEKSDSHWGDVSNGNYTWAASYVGGELPPIVFDAIFGEGAAFGTGNPQLPATVEAPPVGERWEEYDGELQTYETRTLADRLKVTQDDQQYQQIVDQLTWIHNQIMPRLGIEGSVARTFLNSEMYDVITPDDELGPQKWTHVPFRRAWNKGILSYNPDHSMGN
jgi:peptide/nickel transport system substrate-binding protein